VRIDAESVFWQSFERYLRADEKMTVTEGHYSIWCFNTSPGQRELIFDLVKHVREPRKDPRFWIVIDWLYSWGTEEDFVKVQGSMPRPARSAFSRYFKEATKLPGFMDSPLGSWASKVQEARARGDVSAGSTSVPKKKSGPKDLTYPKEGVDRRMMTILDLEIIVGKDGTPKSCRPLPGPWLAFFAPEGIRHAMKFKFEPMPNEGFYLYRIPFEFLTDEPGQLKVPFEFLTD
jgi:hypothetical protein